MRWGQRKWGKRSLINREFYGTERRKTRNLIVLILWSVLLFSFVRLFVVSTGIVDGDSMHPTLRNGDFYLTNRYIYHFRSPNRGDIVVLKEKKYDSDELVKRIIGLPGETIEIRGRDVFINGRPLHEPYLSSGGGLPMPAYLVPDGAYFVMGDNRYFSEDSRRFGSVTLDNIEGRISPGELFAFY